MTRLIQLTPLIKSPVFLIFVLQISVQAQGPLEQSLSYTSNVITKSRGFFYVHGDDPVSVLNGSHEETEKVATNTEYWRAWRCSWSHERFLNLFRILWKKDNSSSSRKCPIHGSLEDDDEPRRIISLERKKRDHQSIPDPLLVLKKINGSSNTVNETGKFHYHGEDNEEIKEEDDLPEVEEHSMAEDLEALQKLRMKKLRGCKWHNETHYCHQYIWFSIQEPDCFHIQKTVGGERRQTEEEEDEESRDNTVVDDLVEPRNEHPAIEKVWIYGIVCCTAEIVFARLGVILLPLLRKDLYEKFIVAMVGLAAGTLTGSAVFHLLPKAFSLEAKPEIGKKYLGRCLIIAAGLWTFLMIERVLKIFFHYNERKVHTRRNTKIMNHLAAPPKEVSSGSITILSSRSFKDIQNPERRISDESDIDINLDNFNLATGSKIFLQESNLSHKENSHSYRPNKFWMDTNELHPIKFQEGSLALVSSQAWMVIVGDSFLDFVDGLSIGTAFHDSILTGFSISLGILLEEFPHELGEFAVLLNAGLPFRQAFILKFLSSCSTYVGLCVGIWVGGVEASHYVFALAAGMFLYIALVDMIPELNEVAFKSSQASVSKGMRVLMIQNIGLLAGMSVIYVMALYEEYFRRIG